MQEKNWDVELSQSSLKALQRLGTKVSSRILNRLEGLGNLGNPLRYKDVRALEGKLKGFYRLRIGAYRVIFELDGENRRIGVLAIVARGKAY